MNPVGSYTTICHYKTFPYLQHTLLMKTSSAENQGRQYISATLLNSSLPKLGRIVVYNDVCCKAPTKLPIIRNPDYKKNEICKNDNCRASSSEHPHWLRYYRTYDALRRYQGTKLPVRVKGAIRLTKDGTKLQTRS